VDTLNDIGAFQTGLPYKAEVSRLYHNNYDGIFTDVTKQVKLDRAIQVMGSNFGDLDNDGDENVFEEVGGAARIRIEIFYAIQPPPTTISPS